MNALTPLTDELARTGRIASASGLALLAEMPAASLAPLAETLTLSARGRSVTFSRKVFVPLTRLCRDVCHYCTFATTPREAGAPYLTIDEMVAIAEAGKAQGCREALFTLGDRPEARYPAARRWLDAHGHASTLDYVAAAARAVVERTGLLPHLNPGVMDDGAITMLRRWSASMGLMLESGSDRLMARGGPHFGSPDKAPAVRLASLRAAGAAAVPFTTGLLIGIGETRAERLSALCAIRDLHAEYGHIQEVIIQNFRAKPGTRMEHAPEPSLDEHVWTVAAARLVLGGAMSIQAPPNLRAGALAALIRAGVDDWGGVSPVTPDHVNPEAAWPTLDRLRIETAAADRILVERTAIGPAYAVDLARWADPAMAPVIRRHIDASGMAREDGWHAGAAPAPALISRPAVERVSPAIGGLLDRAGAGVALNEADIETLFSARGADVMAVARAADDLRRWRVGDAISFVVNRNINYTNICLYSCGFCGFSKGSTRGERGPAYRIDLDEIGARAAEAQAAGATEVCLQGGIHPDYDGDTYIGIVEAVTRAAPGIHIHAFSPLEIWHGADTLGLSLDTYLARLKAAGLSTLPGTAAEILDDEVRRLICPDKLTTAQWLAVMRAAHGQGLRSTATIMFGHVDTPRHWARHLIRVRALQEETGGFTEFVPLPFVHMEAPMARKGLARLGPTWREALLMHAVARIALDGAIANIQVSWPKLGRAGALACLAAGANDFGGVLMSESITRAAGGGHGQAIDAAEFTGLAAQIGRPARQRTTLYGAVSQLTPALVDS